MSFSYGQKIVTNGLVLYLDAANIRSYPKTGNTWYDLSIGTNTGTLNSGSTFNTSNGGSIVFDGTDDNVNCGNNSILDVGNNITVNAWIFLPSTGATTGYRPIVSKVVSGATVGWEMGVSIGKLRCVFRPTSNIIDLTGPDLSIGVWQMCTFSYDNLTTKLYLNGVLRTSTSSGGPVILDSSQPFQIATRGIGGNTFLGRISQVSMYNRALSSSEILQNYNSTKARFQL
jgi:hypothetical protein